MLLTAKYSSKKPEMKNEIPLKTPPTTILWSGFFKMLNLELDSKWNCSNSN